MELHSEYWRSCSTCKKQIRYKSKYFECSVSTCTGKRTGYVFCSIHCWESHLPGAKHRDAGAIEKSSPSFEDWKKECQQESGGAAVGTATTSHSAVNSAATGVTGVRRIISGPAMPGAINLGGHSSTQSAKAFGTAGAGGKSSMENEVLVVVSKMKQYIKDISDMNTSADVAEILSDMIRHSCNEAVDKARQDGRKTVMARDFK